MFKVCRMIIVLFFFAYLSRVSDVPGGEPDLKKAEIKGYFGLWVEQTRELNAIASDLLAKASSVSISDKEFLGIDSCIAAVLSETGDYTVVRIGKDRLEVDVKVTVELSTDLSKKPTQKINRKEIWRLIDGNTLQRCFPTNPADERPKDFKTAKGDGLVLFTYLKKNKK